MPATYQPGDEGPAQGRFRSGFDAVCEKVILGLLVLILIWGPLAFGGVSNTGPLAFGRMPPWTFFPVQGLTVLALGVWLVRIWAQRTLRLLWPPVCWAVFVFLIYALVRCQFVIIEYAARKELIQVVIYASLFFLVINNIHRRESTPVIVVALVTLGLGLAIFAVYQFATHHPTIWGVPRREQFMGRGSATYINPNHMADFLGMMVPLALAYTVMSRLNATVKVLFAYCVLAMLAGIGVSISRGGMLAVAGMLLVFSLVLLYQRGYWLPALGILTVVVLVGIVLSVEFESVQKRFEAAIRSGQLADIRKDYWPAAVHIFEDHPLWGGGPAHFDSEFDKYRPPTVQSRPVYAHNDYLNTLSDWGLTGLLIIAAAVGLLFWGAWKTWPCVRRVELESGALQRGDKAAFLMGACMGLLTILLHCVVDFNMHVPANAVVAVVLMAMVAGLSRFASDRYWIEARWLGKILMTIMIAAAMGWLASEGIKGARESYWLWRAGDESAAAANRLDAMKKAHEAEPDNYVNSYNLGEYYRLTSQQGNADYKTLAREALEWYGRSMRANPLDGYVPMRYGMCLDWLGETNKSEPYFQLAEKLDPNNYHVPYYVGRHYVDAGNYAAARKYFDLSMGVHWNDLAYWSLKDLETKLNAMPELYKK